MDFCGYLPLELLEKIFSYLSARDLVKCSEVSVIWREAANNGNLWRTICEELSLDDPWALRDIESSFEDPSLHFQLPLLPDHLSPMSEWKISYYQQKYIDYNWRRGRNVKHFIKDQRYSVLSGCSQSSKPKQCALIYPIVKLNEMKNDNTDINVLCIDGKPKLVYQHELSPSDDLETFMIEGNTISFIFGRKLKTFFYQNNEFNMVREYDLGPENKLNENAIKICRQLVLNYFIGMISNYLVAACEAYFHVWDRKTGDELGFVNCPTHESTMYCFCLQGDSIYFVTCTGTNCTELYEYYIVEKTLSLVDTIYAHLEHDILSNEHYLILFTQMDLDNDNEAVLFYNRSSKKKVNEITDIEEIYDHSIQHNLLFLMINFEVQIMRIPSCTLETKFKLPYSDMDCIKMHNVGQDLLIISVNTKHIDVWDWNKGVLCSSINCPGRLVWCDPIRLILQQWHSCNESELTVIGFW